MGEVADQRVDVRHAVVVAHGPEGKTRTVRADGDVVGGVDHPRLEAISDALRERVVQDLLAAGGMIRPGIALLGIEGDQVARRLDRDVADPVACLVAGLGDDRATVHTEDGVRDDVEVGVVVHDAPARAAPDGIAFGQ